MCRETGQRLWLSLRASPHATVLRAPHRPMASPPRSTMAVGCEPICRFCLVRPGGTSCSHLLLVRWGWAHALGFRMRTDTNVPEATAGALIGHQPWRLSPHAPEYRVGEARRMEARLALAGRRPQPTVAVELSRARRPSQIGRHYSYQARRRWLRVGRTGVARASRACSVVLTTSVSVS
jgi:hypothetical protein